MSLPSRRPLAEARIALGSFDRFLLLYGTMFAAFRVTSPFLPALLHERGLGPSEIGAPGANWRIKRRPAPTDATERLGVYISVERHLGAIRQADLHRAAPRASAGLTSRLRCD